MNGGDVVVTTGDAAVDAALSRLAGAGDEPASTQVALFEDVHSDLLERLAQTED